ncbi:hypothetical protein FOA43_003648 [Brettanomyces nanus]|uniref:Xylanolytic transcriptional activator regulatory domain-containing protein n=1 Tax=Eeniella nana TaxID=13502 RepID=A0A875S8Q2_EENNA|nr:uncharacterized protein FOA43_003648 [Brettanomyces nanus]QPG76262.1 hypothetical protein FOA43_003648 [Brettanomyces nanus]
MSGEVPENMKGTTGIDLFPTFNASRSEESLKKVFDPRMLEQSLDKCYISPALTKDLDVESIVNTYYKYFHSIHPFLPHREDIMTYLNSVPYNYDLLLAMKIMGDGQVSSIYSRDVETVQFLVTSVVNYIKQVGKDLISLQSLLILAMIAHISSLHDLSMLLREALVSLALELKLNLLDQHTVPDIFMDVNGFITERRESDNNASTNTIHGVQLMNTPSESDTKDDVLTELMQACRVANIPKRILADTIRRTLWEVYFFDTISGTASGHTMSLLASCKIIVLYPTTISAHAFDYKSRAEACKLVNDSIKLNVAIQAEEEVESHLVHMKAAIGNWELRLDNPDMYSTPYLVNANGQVNEGVFEAIMLVNYAQIFTHRPFSYLWRSDVSKHPKCTDEEDVSEDCPPLKRQEVDSQKIIETRKTIDSASSVVKSLLDTNAADVTKRTPFLACALAFSSLVHLSAFSWVESSLQVLGDDASTASLLKENINEEELDTYTEYIKLELGAIYQISRHWALSAKLAQHIKETLRRVSLKLYRKVQAALPEPKFKPVEIAALTPIQKDIRRTSYRTPSLSTSSSTQPTFTKTTTDPVLPDVFSRRPREYIRSLPNTYSGTNPTTSNSTRSPDPGAVSTGNISAEKPEISGQTNLINEINDAELNMMMDDSYLSLSPTSDTGCDWVDKHIFEFDAYNLAAGDESKTPN